MVVSKKISTGCEPLDSLLDGGFSYGQLHLVYGEASTGKTTLLIVAAVRHLITDPGARTFYIDSDHKLTTERLIQISRFHQDLLRRFLLWRPETFKQQAAVIDDLQLTASRGDLVVLDSITNLYRLDTGDKSGAFRANKELNLQLAYLMELTRSREIATIITGQVRDVFERPEVVEPVAPRLLSYWCDTILKLEALPSPGIRQVTLEKPSNFKAVIIKITEKGIMEV